MAKSKRIAQTGERAHPITGQTAHEIQAYGRIARLPIALSEKVAAVSVENLNQVLADTITLRDMYKKHHWQVAGPTFYQLHLLFDKHYEEQNELVDTIAERIQLLGGISLAMARRRRRDDDHPAPARGDARKSPCRSRGSSTRTRSSSRKRAPWPARPTKPATTAPTTCSSPT